MSDVRLSSIVFVALAFASCTSPSASPLGGDPSPAADESAPPASTIFDGPRPSISAERRAALKLLAPQVADRVLRQRREASPRAELSILRHHVDARGDTNVWLRQSVKGVPVRGRDLGAIVREDGVVTPLHQPDPLDHLVLPPARTEEARRIAEERVRARGLEVKDTTVERWIEPRFEATNIPAGPDRVGADLAGETPMRFEVGEVVTVRTKRGEPFEVFVRDEDGAVFDRGSIAKHAAPPQPTLKTLYAGTVTRLTNSMSGRDYTLKDSAGNEVFFYNRGSEISYISSTNTWGDSKPFARNASPLSINGQTGAADAYVSMQVTLSLWSRIFNRNGYDDAGGLLRLYVHDDAIGAMHFRDGEVIAGVDGQYLSSPTYLWPDTSIETIGHEYGHAIFEMTGILPGHQGELGGINEGNSDIFGILAGFHALDVLSPPTGTFPIWQLVPRGNWTLDTGLGDVVRSMVSPREPAWRSGLNALERHEAAGPLDRFFYFLSVGVLPSTASLEPQTVPLAAPGRKSPYLPRGLTGLSVDTAAHLWYDAVTSAAFTQVTNYATTRSAVLTSVANTEGGPYGPRFKAVEDAFAAVNVGAPADRTPPVVTTSAVQTKANEVTLDLDIRNDGNAWTGNVVVESLPPGNALTGGNIVRMRTTCTGSCRIIVDGRYYPYGGVLKVEATDERKNVVNATRSFYFDVSGPIISSFQNLFNHQGPVQWFKWSATDPAGIASASYLEGETLLETSSYANPTTVSETNDGVDLAVLTTHGNHTLTFQVKDRWGNATSRNFDFFRDLVRPDQCTLMVPSRVTNGMLPGSISGHDADTGTYGLALIIDGQQLPVAWSNVTSVKQATFEQAFTVPLAVGTHNVQARCSDWQANTLLSASQVVVSAPPPPPPPPSSTPQCGQEQREGGDEGDERSFTMSRSSGRFDFKYQTFEIPDRMFVVLTRTNGSSVLLYDSTCRWTDGEVPVTLAYSGGTKITVVVMPNCSGTRDTRWSYTVGCATP